MASTAPMATPETAGYTPLGTTTRLSGADEAKSQEKLLPDRLNYAEWPNDAGFEGLTEHRGPVDLKVSGNIPPWAVGSLYRTGPGICTVEDTATGTFHISHWFDGLAHTHRFDILCDTDGNEHKDTNGHKRSAPVRVQYSSLRQCDALVQDIKAAGTIQGVTFGQRSDPCVGLYSKFMTAFVKPPKGAPDNICVTVQANVPGLQKTIGHRSAPGSVFLGTDAAKLSEIDPKTLRPLGAGPNSHADLHPDLKGAVGPAHPCVDPETGDYFSFNIALGPRSTYRVFRVDPSGQVSTLATFNAKAAYIHSFFLSPNYVILCIPVAHYDGIHLIWNRSFTETFRPFNKNQSCKWIVVDRRHGKGIVAQFRSPASFFFHSSNAFEDTNGDIICELVSFRNRTIIDALYYDVLVNRDSKGEEFWSQAKNSEDARPHLVRYRLSKAEFRAPGGKPQKKSVPAAKKELDIPGPCVGDLPTINPAYKCRKHRYVWSLVSRRFSTLFDAIGKTDTETGAVVLWEGPRGHTPGEAIFVARPAAEGAEAVGEDDGVLLSVVLDGLNRTSYLLCLDAKTMLEVGRAECDFAIGIGFHGQHLRNGVWGASEELG